MLIAGVQSGCGKTTATLAIMGWLRAHSLRVAPFKAGPDFLDPMWHTAICGTTSYNLDSRMMHATHCRRLYAEKSATADVVVIEGAMGLFDGAHGVGEAGSAAHLARLLDEPVLLVVDAKGMSGSLVALVEGFATRARDMGVTLAGIIANRVGSTHHADLLAGLLDDHRLPPLVAWLEKDAPTLPERHLGLVMPEPGDLPDLRATLHVVREALLINREHPAAPTAAPTAAPPPVPPRLSGKRIAIARDDAFCFPYAANLEWLADSGARLCFFSLLAGEPLPEGSDALWLPGGYPELHGDALSHSASWPSIRAFITRGGPTLAECGGMMALGREIVTDHGTHAMAGILPHRFIMQPRLAGLGYREDANGIRGHAFHHSTREALEETPPAFALARGDCGVRIHNLRASYTHWYFPSQPEVAASWFICEDSTDGD